MSHWVVYYLIAFAPILALLALGLRAIRARNCHAWADYSAISSLLGWLTPAVAVLAVQSLNGADLSAVRLALLCAAPTLAYSTLDHAFGFTSYRRRLKDPGWTRELVRRALGGWVRAMMPSATITLYLLSSALFSEGDFVLRPSVRLFVAFLMASWAGYWFGSIGRSASQYMPGEMKLLAPCELATRTSEIAAQLGVNIHECRIVTEVPFVWGSGFAYGPGAFALTEDLIAKLSKTEVDAIVAHEVGHVAHRLYWWLYVPAGLLAWLGWLAVALLVERVMPSTTSPFHFLTYLLWVCLFVVPRLSRLWYSRWAERGANRCVSALVDPRAGMSAFYKLSLVNDIPYDRPRWLRFLSTHPTLRQDVETTAREHGIGAEEVERILRQAEKDLADDHTRHYEPVFHQAVERELAERPSKREFSGTLWTACLLFVFALFGGIAGMDRLYSGRSSVTSIAVTVSCALLFGVALVAVAYRRRRAAYGKLRASMRDKLESMYPQADASMLLVDAVLMSGWDEQIWQGALIGVADGKLVVLGELGEAEVDAASVTAVSRYDAGRSRDDLLGGLHPVVIWYEVHGAMQWIGVTSLGTPEKGLPRTARQLEAHIRALLTGAGAGLELAKPSARRAGYVKRGIAALILLAVICILLNAVLRWLGAWDSWLAFGMLVLIAVQWLWHWVVGYDTKRAARAKRPRRG